MKKQIQKPSNWQDFETLCKILWGEIWKISDKIKKNGRNGQPQSGVDIYGIPNEKLNYNGIQCKGKDDYSSAKLTRSEIDNEIQKAKNFKPELETFIFATTANKDVEIEEYIRIKDIENRKAGSFEILIFCWEDIADLIEINRQTYDYYILKNQFKSNLDIAILFDNDESEMIVNPKFIKTITKYRYIPKYEELEKGIYASLQPLNYFFEKNFSPPSINIQPSSFSYFGSYKRNLSWIKFRIKILNTGDQSIENWKLYIIPEKNKFRDFSDKENNGVLPIISSIKKNLYVFEDENYAIYSPNDNSPLVQKDKRYFELFILPKHEKYTINLEYEFLAKDLHKEGQITLNIVPEFEIFTKTIEVDSPDKIRDDKILIEDKIETKEV